MKKINRRSFLKVVGAGVAAMSLTACGAAGSTAASSVSSAAASTGAASSEAAGPDLSEHVVLTMYCIGDEGGIHAQEHIDAINAKLTESINAEIKPVMVSWGDYKSKLPMVWASGEAYDLTFVGNWTGYYTEGSKGAFMDITDLLPEYAPTIAASVEERGVAETLKINGSLYMVPANIQDYTGFVLNYREDLRKKYNCPEIVDEATLEQYLAAVRDNETGMQAYGGSGTDVVDFQNFLTEHDWSRPIENSSGFFCYDLKNPTKVFNVVETPEYAEFIKRQRGFYDSGFVSKSIMAETDQQKDSFTAGKCGTYLGTFQNSITVYNDVKGDHPDWEIAYYSSDLASGNVELISPANNGMAVGAYSKHPDRALMLLEQIFTDRELYNLFLYGLEGITYEWDPATSTKWTPEGADPSELPLKNLGMGVKYQQFELGAKDDPEALIALRDQYEKCGLVPELSGMVINQDNISAEIAGLKAVQDEYKFPLEKGVVDADSGLETLKKRMAEAGAQSVLDELNAQIAAYLA